MEIKTFGIKALEALFQAFLFAQGEFGVVQDRWEHKNLQPGRKARSRLYWYLGGHNICPHYDLIELCADIMGIKPSELAKFDYFCGFLIKTTYLPVSMSLLPKKGATKLIPFRCCGAIRDILTLAIDYAKSERPKPIGEISGSPSEKQRKELKDFLIADKRFKEGRQILRLWARTIPENVGVRKKKYSEKQLIFEAENLLQQLKKKAAGDIFSLTGPCEVAPKYEFSQLFPLD
jgi:hypothetical protein